MIYKATSLVHDDHCSIWQSAIFRQYNTHDTKQQCRPTSIDLAYTMAGP